MSYGAPFRVRCDRYGPITLISFYSDTRCILPPIVIRFGQFFVYGWARYSPTKEGVTYVTLLIDPIPWFKWHK